MVWTALGLYGATWLNQPASEATPAQDSVLSASVGIHRGVTVQAGPSVSKRPVVLVAGIFDTGDKMTPVDDALARYGFNTRYKVDLIPSDGSVSLTILAAQLKVAIERICTQNQTQTIDLVAYSMGAIVSRYYLQNLGGLRRTAHLVTIAAPHHGTLAGFFVKGPAPREMRTGSQFMAQLNDGAGILCRIPCASLWTPFDGVILPASSSVVPWAHNQAFRAPTHPDMLGDRDVQASVAAALLR
jgi:triacylglycerol lipase